MNNVTHDHMEQMRQDLSQLLKENNQLRNEIDLLKKIISDEQEEKYKAYIRIADLTRELHKN